MFELLNVLDSDPILHDPSQYPPQKGVSQKSNRMNAPAP
jgi:hypothetical protein